MHSAAPERATQSLVTTARPKLTERFNAVATRFELLPPCAVCDVRRQFAHAKMHTLGSVYAEDGQVIKTSMRSGGHGGDHVTAVDPGHVPTQQLAKAQRTRLNGRSLFLGPFMNHYGHFITESLSRCWLTASGRIETFDQYLFYPFLFNNGEIIISEFHRHFFRVLGVPLERIHILREPVELEHVVIPEQLWVINTVCHSAMAGLYARLRTRPTQPARAEWCFLSRKPAVAGRFAHADAVERLFAESGFQIIYPEDMPIAEQLDLYGSCKIMAGFSGSAMHNCLFASGETLVIEVGDSRTRETSLPMQLICNALTKLPYFYIPYRETSPGNPDLGYVTASLSEALRLQGA